MHSREKGITAVELLVAIPLLSLIALGIASNIALLGKNTILLLRNEKEIQLTNAICTSLDEAHDAANLVPGLKLVTTVNNPTLLRNIAPNIANESSALFLTHLLTSLPYRIEAPQPLLASSKGGRSRIRSCAAVKVREATEFYLGVTPDGAALLQGSLRLSARGSSRCPGGVYTGDIKIHESSEILLEINGTRSEQTARSLLAVYPLKDLYTIYPDMNGTLRKRSLLRALNEPIVDGIRRLTFSETDSDGVTLLEATGETTQKEKTPVKCVRAIPQHPALPWDILW